MIIFRGDSTDLQLPIAVYFVFTDALLAYLAHQRSRQGVLLDLLGGNRV